MNPQAILQKASIRALRCADNKKTADDALTHALDSLENSVDNHPLDESQVITLAKRVTDRRRGAAIAAKANTDAKKALKDAWELARSTDNTLAFPDDEGFEEE